jgi:hypothetical protein
VQNYLWWNACLRLLLLHDRVVKPLLHSFYAYVLLLHYLPQLLRVRLHQIHCLIVHIHVGHLCVRGVVLVIVRLKMSRIDVICCMSRSGSKILNVISRLQRSVPHQAS